MCVSKPVVYRLIILFLGCSGLVKIQAQENVLDFPDNFYRIERAFLRTPGYHAVFNSPSISIERQKFLIDSLYGSNRDLVYSGNGKNAIIINPVLQSSYRTSPKFLQHYAAGFRLESEFAKKFLLELNYSAHFLTNHAFPDSRLDSASIIAHWGKSHSINNSLSFLNSLNGKITYTPNRFLAFQLGNDKHFWGDGYRSLFLSDNAPSSPHFTTTLTIWNLKYTNLFTLLRDDTIGNYSKLQTKYASMHLLSWNVNKRLNLNIFEAVVWRHRDDSLNYRGVSLTYLNPFVFYRPLEYNLGSPDNVLIGFGMHYLAGQNVMLYGQFLLDEFYYKEMLKGKGWWANKNAYQLGIKCFDFGKIKNLYLQMEYNQARPFTYGHDYPLQNYGYMLQPLAHPLGTNFREGLMMLRYSKNRWFASATISYSKYGLEPGGRPIGGDIYRSSNNFAKTEGNYIGQGVTNNLFEQEIALSRLIQSHWGLIVEAGVHNTFFVLPEKRQNIYFTFGIKTLLYREEKLF